MTKKEQIKIIEETASDAFMEYMEVHPTEDRFDAPEMVMNFGYSIGTYFAALQAIYWVPFEIWRKTHKKGYLEFVDKANAKKIGIHEAILDEIVDSAIDKIYWVLEKFLPKKDNG